MKLLTVETFNEIIESLKTNIKNYINNNKTTVKNSTGTIEKEVQEASVAEINSLFN